MKEWKKKLFRKMLWKNIFYNTDYWEKKYCNELNIFFCFKFVVIYLRLSFGKDYCLLLIYSSRLAISQI